MLLHMRRGQSIVNVRLLRWILRWSQSWIHFGSTPIDTGLQVRLILPHLSFPSFCPDILRSLEVIQLCYDHMNGCLSDWPGLLSIDPTFDGQTWNNCLIIGGFVSIVLATLNILGNYLGWFCNQFLVLGKWKCRFLTRFLAL